MNRLLLLLIAPIFFYSCTALGEIQNKTPLTEAEAAQGIREALDQGVGRGISVLHREDGFFGNPVYKLTFPPEAQRMEAAMRQIGMGAMLDRAILQINRSAEDAVGAASPIFAKAISGMTLTDALNIVRGPQDAATQYFRDKTTNQLKAAFAPLIKLSLDKFSATKYYEEVVTTYNKFPTTLQKVNPDLTAYVTDRAIAALFDQVAKEEAAIRSSASARKTAVLKRVFGRG